MLNHQNNHPVSLFIRLIDLICLTFWGVNFASLFNLMTFDFISHGFQLLFLILGGTLSTMWAYYRMKNERDKNNKIN